MQSLLRLAIALLAFSITTPLLAERLEIIELQHRPAEEVVPLLRPFLAEGGTLSGQRGQLFIRTTPQNLIEIKKILSSLDKSPEQLMITVLQGEATKLAGDEAQLNASLGIGGDGRLTAGSPASPNDSVELRIRSTRSRHRDEDVQQVRVLEGSPATIYLGQLVPIGSRTTTTSPWGSQTSDTIEYRSVSTGFTVLPRISGQRVTLEIAAQRDSLSRSGGGRINVQGVNTTITGALGEWIEIGGSAVTESRRERGVIYRSTGTLHSNRRVLIRVERLQR